MLQGVSQKYFFLLCFIIVLLFSCKSKKYVFETSTIKIDPSEIDSILQNQNIDFEWYAAKAKFKFHADSISESGTSYIRIRKDSVIWMVLKKYSIEGIRLQMTPDSFTIMDRIDKSVITLNWDEMRNWYKMNIDFNTMQELVVGNILYQTDLETKISAEDSLVYSGLQRDMYFDYHYSVPYFEKRVSQFKMVDYYLRSLEVNYENCSSEDDYCFLRTYNISSSSTEEIYLSLKLSDLELDVPKNIKFDIPPHYTRF